MSKLNQLREFVARGFPANWEMAPDDNGLGADLNREGDMGGSDDEHEIDWGDVTDVVKEAMRQSVDETLRASMEKSGLSFDDADGDDYRESEHYKAAVDSAEKTANRLGNMLKKMHERGFVRQGRQKRGVR